MSIKIALTVFFLTSLLALNGRAEPPPTDPQPQIEPTLDHVDTMGTIVAPPKAITNLLSKSGSKVSGTVTFSETGTGIEGTYKIKGLPANGKFGFHIHAKGDCSSADGSSAGTHYLKLAPTGGTSLQTPEKYAGDLPPITSDNDGNANSTFQATGLTIGKKNSILNHAVILHEKSDDVTKKSSPRIACGVIKQMNK